MSDADITTIRCRKCGHQFPRPVEGAAFRTKIKNAVAAGVGSLLSGPIYGCISGRGIWPDPLIATASLITFPVVSYSLENKFANCKCPECSHISNLVLSGRWQDRQVGNWGRLLYFVIISVPLALLTLSVLAIIAAIVEVVFEI